jgi:dipeptidyl-peptidase-4
VSVDNRGTPAPRGRAFRKAIHRKIGVLNAADQAHAAQTLLQRPWADASRVGIWGWSGGGSTTLNAIFRYPGIYTTGIAVAPVPDLRLYDTIYQERYMGLPQVNAEEYRLGSPITFADSLRGDLLVVHGTGDDNVHYQGTERLINRLIAANKQFRVMPYPNRTHCICEGGNTGRHLFTMLEAYLAEKLPAGPR